MRQGHHYGNLGYYENIISDRLFRSLQTLKCDRLDRIERILESVAPRQEKSDRPPYIR